MRWAMLEQAPDQNSRRVLIQAMRLAELTGKPEDELVTAIEDRIARLSSPDRNLRWEEYQQFVRHKQPFGENTEFEIRPAAAPPELASWLQAVTRATRLREVRALRGFTRVFPPSADDDERVGAARVAPAAAIFRAIPAFSQILHIPSKPVSRTRRSPIPRRSQPPMPDASPWLWPSGSRAPVTRPRSSRPRPRSRSSRRARDSASLAPLSLCVARCRTWMRASSSKWREMPKRTDRSPRCSMQRSHWTPS